MTARIDTNEEWDTTLGLYVSQLPDALINCALKRAFWNELASWIHDDNTNLLSLDQYMLSTQLTRWHDMGVKEVAVDQVRGFTTMGGDYDKALMPHQEQICHRWTSVDRARFLNGALSPIDLLKIGDVYFILGGHHRISTASIHNHEFVEAHVIEVEEDFGC